uniref:Cytochrome c oxidase subunit 2 n=1 Tax=Prionopetalum kraepelini TaxID=2931675 RepID=A0A8T9JB22_9MYRI|nr:cytochrome c oxidase subunit II [Prionopetalum kraepelini]UOF70467.1 cytochrome c oxidase subunit II [Prionopetalum kraepelini]
MATSANLMFQNAASPLMEQLIFFHDHIMLILTMILSLVMYMYIMLASNKMTNRFLLEGQEIETVWTLLPGIILVFIALPSLRLLYLLDEINNPDLTIKSVGHQWYWSYEYSDFNEIEFDSYMLPNSSLSQEHFRLLDVDNRTVLPINAQIRILITAADVLHSWTVPALGVKADAVPNRLNQVSFIINRPGLWYGQCSEICGANHSFMPIVLESIPMKYFIHWLTNNN